MASRRGGQAGKGEFRIRIRIDPSPAAVAKILGGLGDEFDDLRPVWRDLRVDLARGIQQNIDQRGVPLDAGRWPGPVHRYVSRKLREGYGGRELVRTGALVAAATSPTRGVLAMRKNALTFGVRQPGARAVHFGYTRSVGLRIRRRVRGRPFMGWNEAMRAAVDQRISEFTSLRLRQVAERMNSLARRVA
jgi:hypothetical protein